MLGALFVGLVVVWLGVNLVKEPSEFYGLFLIGLTNGAVYGLVALGYSLVYGILSSINFARRRLHARRDARRDDDDRLVATSTGIGLWGGILLMLLITMVFCAVINTTIEIVAYRRLGTLRAWRR